MLISYTNYKVIDLDHFCTETAMAKYDGHWPVTTQSRVQFPAAPEIFNFFLSS